MALRMVEHEAFLHKPGAGQSANFDDDSDEMVHHIHEEGKHRIFHWMHTLPGDENDEIHPSVVVEKAGVPQKVLLQHISSELEEESSLLSLPFALLLVVVYAVSFSNHDRAHIVRDVEDAISFDIEENANFAFSDAGFMGHKTVYDLNSYADFYSWLRVGLRGLVLSHYTATPEDYMAPPIAKLQESRLYYLNFNRLIGGVRLQQSRANQQPVEDENLRPLYGKDLFPPSRLRNSAFDEFQLDLRFRPTIRSVRMLEPNYDPDMTRWFLVSDSEAQLDAKLADVENEQWITERFVEVSLNFMVYNAYVGTLCYTTVNIFQSRSGHMWRSITTQTLHMQIYPDDYFIALLIVDVVFAFLLCWILFTELRELVHEFLLQKRAAKTVATPTNGWSHWIDFVREYMGPWNFVDWVTIGFGFCLVAQFLQNVGSTTHIRELLDKVETSSEVVQLNTLFEDFAMVAIEADFFRQICAIYPIVIMLRLFKAFAAQPRLALVTNTLHHSITDVGHFGIVFMAIFCSYSLMGMGLFGREMPEFATFERAFNMCFMAIMGDYDVSTMKLAGRGMAMMWFWSFCVMVSLIMLNMLLAIIMDSYSAVMAQTGNAESFFDQLYELYRRWSQNRKGLRISLQKIQDSYEQHLQQTLKDYLAHRGVHAEEKQIFVSDFMDIVPNLKEDQAKRLLTSAAQDYKQAEESKHPLGLSESVGLLANIYQKLNHHIQDSQKREIERGISREKPTLRETPEVLVPPQFSCEARIVEEPSEVRLEPAKRPRESPVASVAPASCSGDEFFNCSEVEFALAETYSLQTLLLASTIALYDLQSPSTMQPGSFEVMGHFVLNSLKAWNEIQIQQEEARGRYRNKSPLGSGAVQHDNINAEGFEACKLGQIGVPPANPVAIQVTLQSNLANGRCGQCCSGGICL